MNKHSTLVELGLPDQFGVLLLVLALILLLAPYLSGQDLGVIKVPRFRSSSKRLLRVFGPLAMLGALLLHARLFETPKEQVNDQTERPLCFLAGTVFDRDTSKPLPGIMIDVYRDQSAISQRPVILKRVVATTGLDGKFSFDCNSIDKLQFPIILGVSHRDWLAIMITGPKIEKPGKWDGINIPLSMKNVELKPLPEIHVRFSGKRVNGDWFAVGEVENKSSRSFPCIEVRFQMRTGEHEKLLGNPDEDLGFLDVEIRDLKPNESRPFEKKLPKAASFYLLSKRVCR